MIVLLKWWGMMDSNHRRRTPMDLQSTPFGHSGNPPKYFNLNQVPFESLNFYNDDSRASLGSYTIYP